MVSLFQFICDGPHGRDEVAKHCIELLQTKAATVRKVPQRADLITQEVGKAKIKTTLSKNIIKPAQTERVDPMVFVTKKDETIRFCEDYRKLSAVAKRYLNAAPCFGWIV